MIDLENTVSEIRIIIAGSRDFDNFYLLSTTVSAYLKNITGLNSNQRIVIVSGGARGADQLGERFAKIHRLDLKLFPAHWDAYGKSAGYIRNREMAKYAAEVGDNGMLIAFWDGKSKGTKHMIDLAKQYNVKTLIIKTCNE